MITGLDHQTLLLGVLILLARIFDVGVGTMRTINIVHGRTTTAFFLGFFEISLWLFVISTVLGRIMQQPILGIFYALGFSLGNVVGIKLEKKLAMGNIILRVISHNHTGEMAKRVRESGYAVTEFRGEGFSGPVVELFIVCRRRDMEQIISIVKKLEPEAFYITEHAGNVSKLYRPLTPPVTGWRSIFKKK